MLDGHGVGLALSHPRVRVCARTAWDSAVVKCVAAAWTCSVLRATGGQIIWSSVHCSPSIYCLCLHPLLLLIWLKGGTLSRRLELWRRGPRRHRALWYFGGVPSPLGTPRHNMLPGGRREALCEAWRPLEGSVGLRTCQPASLSHVPRPPSLRLPLLAPHGGLSQIPPLCSLVLSSLPLAPPFVSLSRCGYSQWLSCLCILTFGSKDG